MNWENIQCSEAASSDDVLFGWNEIQVMNFLLKSRNGERKEFKNSLLSP